MTRHRNTHNFTCIRLLALVPLAFLAACAGVLESNRPAREIYLLQPPSATPLTPATDAPRLVLSLVTVPGLDTDDIQVLAPNARLIPVANAHWPDHLPEVMSSLSRRTLVDSGQFSSVTLNDLARPGDWQLQLELQAFYGIQDSAGTTTSVRMEIEGNLHCGETRKVLRLDSLQNVRSASLADLVSAHQQALNDTLPQLPQAIGQNCAEGPDA
jgi:ABC-type uncharacterized transport system auxiliary subunit